MSFYLIFKSFSNLETCIVFISISVMYSFLGPLNWSSSYSILVVRKSIIQFAYWYRCYFFPLGHWVIFHSLVWVIASANLWIEFSFPASRWLLGAWRRFRAWYSKYLIASHFLVWAAIFLVNKVIALGQIVWFVLLDLLLVVFLPCVLWERPRYG